MQNSVALNNEELNYRLQGKNWVSAFMLCTIFGLLGLHRFYTGYKTQGIIFIILTFIIVGLPFSILWAGIDWFMLLIGGYRHADGDELYERITLLAVIYVIMSVIVLLGILLVLLIGAASIPAILSGN